MDLGIKHFEVCEAIHSASVGLRVGIAFACLVAATNFVYSASDEHTAFSLALKEPIDAWRCEASFLHVTHLVHQAASAESSNDCSWTRACFLPSQEAFRLFQFA